MDYSLATRLIAEVIATALLIILGNGAVANVELDGTKAGKGNWNLIAMGYGFAVMMPAMIFGGISGNHINPAFTIGLAASGMFPWAEVVPYILAQFTGAILGQLVVYITHKPYYDQTENAGNIFGTFSTTNAANSIPNGFINEFFGSFVLFFGALGITKSPLFTTNPGGAHLALGFLVWALVISLGGPTGPGLNPARDLGPRLLYTVLPIKNKIDPDWKYGLIAPGLAPIIAGVIAVATYSSLFM